MPRKHAIDESTFEKIDREDKAYSLGFLIADGWVQYKNKGVTVAVHRKDVEVIDYIRACCGSSAPLFVKLSTGFGATRETVGVNLCSVKMTRDLAALGVVPNKSHSTTLPSIPDNMVRHLLRGLFDGDGHINPRQFILVGSSALLHNVADVVRHHIQVPLSIGASSTGYPRIWGGRGQINLLHWIYSDCEFALSRKLLVYNTHWKHLGARGTVTGRG